MIIITGPASGGSSPSGGRPGSCRYIYIYMYMCIEREIDREREREREMDNIYIYIYMKLIFSNRGPAGLLPLPACEGDVLCCYVVVYHIIYYIIL